MSECWESVCRFGQRGGCLRQGVRLLVAGNVGVAGNQTDLCRAMCRGQSLDSKEHFLRGVGGHASEASRSSEVVEAYNNLSWTSEVQCSTQPFKGASNGPRAGPAPDGPQGTVTPHAVQPQVVALPGLTPAGQSVVGPSRQEPQPGPARSMFPPAEAKGTSRRSTRQPYEILYPKPAVAIDDVFEIAQDCMRVYASLLARAKQFNAGYKRLPGTGIENETIA
ncbi:hypothetical protein Purlil1_11796 [Purpureocillium lilacinum]|uniref:Uncharacterized protein n=1 Tax=Purpureocillium lilacinum TaxID=33203 RepID=A0ABR0BIS7_PURLI|nr:hypothetical protein Purlil1_11796 [Purpureocillium lilacinum]